MRKKYKAVIIDDEPPGREIIKKYLEEFPQIELAGECENGFEGLKVINKINPELVFLDIQMPKLNGFEMLELIENAPAIIFVTAYDQYALKAFEVSAADYLLKPFSPERFRESVEKALRLMKTPGGAENRVHRLVQLHQQQTPIDRVVVKEGMKITVIPVENIIRLEAQGDYVMLHTTGGKFLKQKTMKYFEDHLPAGEYIRIHRSHIVKISAIRQIEPLTGDSYEAVLTNGEALPVSKRGYQQLKQIIE